MAIFSSKNKKTEVDQLIDQNQSSYAKAVARYVMSFRQQE